MSSHDDLHFEIDPNDPTVLFVKELAENLPELKEVLRVHLEDNGEILPIVLMDQYSREVLQRFASGQDQSSLNRYAEILERAMKDRGEDVATLIRTTFCGSVDEYYWDDKSLFERMASLIGPSLRSCLTMLAKTSTPKKRSPRKTQKGV